MNNFYKATLLKNHIKPFYKHIYNNGVKFILAYISHGSATA